MPALRERLDDILVLARAALESLPPREGGKRLLAPEAQRALLSHAWPGNVRELFNRIQRAALVATGEALTPSDLGLAPDGSSGTAASETPEERSLVEEALNRHEGSVSRAAEEMGLSRQAFYRKMEKLGITLERRPKD